MKNRILQKSSELFFTLGVKTTTMDDISSSLGISKKTIYEYYPNKTDLLRNVTNWILKSIDNIIKEVEKQKFNPIEEYFVIKDKIDEFFYYKSSNSCNFQLQKFYPEIFAGMQQKNIQMLDEIIIRNYNRGKEQGLYIEVEHPLLISRFYSLGIWSIHQESVFNDLNINEQQLKKHFLYYHLQAIITEKGRKIFNELLQNYDEKKYS